MKIIKSYLSENFQCLEVKFSIYLNRRVFVMCFMNVTLSGANRHDKQIRNLHIYHIQYKLNDSNTDSSFTLDNLNSF